MSLSKPFHRNYREMKKGANSGYSSWAYIIDKSYAMNAEHYTRPLLIIQDDLKKLFEYIEPSDECLDAFSYRIHALLMRACIEVEANFKAILLENKFEQVSSDKMNMKHYRKVDVTHHLSSYEVMLPIWNEAPRVIRPFERWKASPGQPVLPESSIANQYHLPWYRAYNKSKHDRQLDFKSANFENLLDAIAGLLVIVSSQFRDNDFSAGPTLLELGGYGYHSMEPAIGSLFRIQYPNDWRDDEKYDFDWGKLRLESERFERINYDNITVY